MADYWIDFSAVMDLKSEDQVAYAMELHEKARKVDWYEDDPLNSDEDAPLDWPTSLANGIESWRFEVEPANFNGNYGLWFRADCSHQAGVDDIESLCRFIQHLLQQFNPTGRFGFQWSRGCTRPRLDAYGGGAAVITANSMESFYTDTWLQEHGAEVPGYN